MKLDLPMVTYDNDFTLRGQRCESIVDLMQMQYFNHAYRKLFHKNYNFWLSMIKRFNHLI